MFEMPNVKNKKLPLKRLETFYSNVTIMANSGLSLDQIFHGFSRTETDLIHKKQFLIITNKLRAGQPLIECLNQIQMLPEFDVPLLKAAIQMGRIPELTKKLAVQYEQLNRSLSEIQGQMFQPIFTLLMAIFVKDFADLIASKITTTQYFLRASVPLLVVFCGAGLFFWIWRQSQYLRRIRNIFYSTFGVIPGLNQFILSLAVQRFSLAFELALETGMDLYQSLDLAGESSGFEKVRIATKRLVPMIQQGVSLESALKVETVFPKEFVIAIDIGINSGRMPEAIRQYRTRLEIDIEKSRKLIVTIIPRVIQIAVAIYVVSMILGFYAQSFKALDL